MLRSGNYKYNIIIIIIIIITCISILLSLFREKLIYYQIDSKKSKCKHHYIHSITNFLRSVIKL
jgi:hypothetical protein